MRRAAWFPLNVFAIMVAIAASAHADSGPPLAAKDSTQSNVTPAANSDRVWFAPTALTPPAGTLLVTDTDLFWAGVSYAPTDRLWLSVRGSYVPGFQHNEATTLSAEVKARIFQRGPLTVATRAGLLGRLSRVDNDYGVPGFGAGV